MYDTVRQLLDRHDVQAALITHLPHVRWLCGFTGSSGCLLVTLDGAHLLTDSRYAEQAEREVAGATVHIRSVSVYLTAKRKRLLEAVKRLIFQPEYLSVQDYEMWNASFPDVKWIRGEKMLARAVAIKTAQAVAKMDQAQAISDSVYESILETIKPGRSEQEIAAEINYRHQERGACGMAFDTIVASGPNSALPHARPGSRILKAGDCIILDFGCMYEGYASDMTRTVFLGVPTSEMKDVYATVREAQQCAIVNTTAGVECRTIDSAAREVIQEAGYGDAIAHSTGHGIGLEVHEWPRIAPEGGDELPEGITITIEPGIYLPGKFGVRIEDVVLVGRGECRRLSKVTRKLVELSTE